MFYVCNEQSTLFFVTFSELCTLNEHNGKVKSIMGEAKSIIGKKFEHKRIA